MSAGPSVWDDGETVTGLDDPWPSTPVDLAVIGGGLAGLSVAYHALVRHPGLRVAVIEAGRIGGGATGRSTGMVGPGVGQSLRTLVQRLGAESACRAYEATLAAVEATVDLVRREHIACDLEETGQILLARSRSDRRRLQGQAELMDRLALPHLRLDDRRLHAHVRLALPEGSDADGPAGLRLPTAALVHPGKLAAGLTTCIRSRGGTLYEGRRVLPLGAGVTKGAPFVLSTDSVAGPGEVRAGRVVTATGGYTPSLGLFRGRVLPLHLQALATSPLPPAALEQLGWTGREGIVEASRIFDYFRLTADNRLVFGGGAPRYLWKGRDDAGSAARSLRRLEGELRQRFASVPALASVPITHAWTGVIDYVLDGLPVIGASREEPRLQHLLGLCGHGLALSIAAGAWVADHLDDAAGPSTATGLAGLRPWLEGRPGILVPTEPLRWLACRAAAAAMGFLDRVA